jgi:hypothetical protein
MIRYYRNIERFAFWLSNQFLPHQHLDEENLPISNKEFVITLGMIIAALIVLSIVFKQ